METIMQYIKILERRDGVDAGYHSSNLHPIDKEGCVGKCGINKLYTLDQVIELAYKMEQKPNIIIKGGKNAKWYLKKFSRDVLEEAIQKEQNWRPNSTRRCTMYIIEWK
jgi:hypothetical protein